MGTEAFQNASFGNASFPNKAFGWLWALCEAPLESHLFNEWLQMKFKCPEQSYSSILGDLNSDGLIYRSTTSRSWFDTISEVPLESRLLDEWLVHDFGWNSGSLSWVIVVFFSEVSIGSQSMIMWLTPPGCRFESSSMLLVSASYAVKMCMHS